MSVVLAFIADYWPEAVVVVSGGVSLFAGSARRGDAAEWLSRHVPPRFARAVAGLASLAVLGVAFFGFDVVTTWPARIHVLLGVIVAQLTVWLMNHLAYLREARIATEAQGAADRAHDGVEQALHPLCLAVLKVVGAPPGDSRSTARADAVNAALTSAAALVGGSDDIRATYYKTNARGPQILKPRLSVGPRRPAKTVFKATDPLGASIYAALRAGRHTYVSDITTANLPGWTHGPEHTWRSFLSVPVASADERLLGMLVVDSSEVDDFDEEREPDLLSSVAFLLAAIETA